MPSAQVFVCQGASHLNWEVRLTEFISGKTPKEFLVHSSFYTRGNRFRRKLQSIRQIWPLQGKILALGAGPGSVPCPWPIQLSSFARGCWSPHPKDAYIFRGNIPEGTLPKAEERALKARTVEGQSPSGEDGSFGGRALWRPSGPYYVVTVRSAGHQGWKGLLSPGHLSGINFMDPLHPDFF